MFRFTKKRLVFVVVGLLAVLISLSVLNHYLSKVRRMTVVSASQRAVIQCNAISYALVDYYKEAYTENSENLVDGFIDFFNSRSESVKLSKELPSKVRYEFYVTLPKRLESSNCMIIGYSEMRQDSYRGKKLGKYRILFVLRGKDVEAVVVDDHSAGKIIGYYNLRFDNPDFYY